MYRNNFFYDAWASSEFEYEHKQYIYFQRSQRNQRSVSFAGVLKAAAIPVECNPRPTWNIGTQPWYLSSALVHAVHCKENRATWALTVKPSPANENTSRIHRIIFLQSNVCESEILAFIALHILYVKMTVKHLKYFLCSSSVFITLEH